MENVLWVNDLFCGTGGMGLGFKQAGFRVAGAYDFDRWAVESYGNNVSQKVKHWDISQMEGKDLPYANVWTFGFPCQDISVAGKQAGMVKGKTRSGLFYEVMRLLEETEQIGHDRLPKVLLAENVKAVKRYIPEIEAEYDRHGYKLYYALYNSKYWGVPQSRERYFMVGIRKDLQQTFQFPAEQQKHIPKLSSILEGEVDEKYYIADEKAQKIIEQALQYLDRLGNVHTTITPNRVEKRQNGRRAKADEEEMFTITAQDLHGVIQSVYTDKDGCAYCCDANYYKGTSPGDVGNGRRTQVIEVNPKCVGLLDIKAHDHSRRVYATDGDVIRPTLTAVQGGTHHIKVSVEYNRKDGIGKELEVAHTLTASDWRGLNRNQNKNAVVEGYRVRRLTPREYARLQGFPDTFAFHVSDTQLYKQFGNAVSVPVAKVLAEAIKEFLT